MVLKVFEKSLNLILTNSQEFCVLFQREAGVEKYDIALQKLDEEDAAEDLLRRMEAESLEHYNYAKVRLLHVWHWRHMGSHRNSARWLPTFGPSQLT